MNLLLLLSALLSALTGVVGGSVRGTGMVSAVSVGTAIAATVTDRRLAAASRPSQPLPALASLAGARLAAAFSLQSHPLYASRRRE